MVAAVEVIFEPPFAAAPPEVRVRLEQIAEAVERRVPGAERCISYSMPAYRLQRVFFYFAAFRKHIGIYPPAIGPAGLMAKLDRYRGPKGNLIFPHTEELPINLIEQAVEAMARKYGSK